MKVVIVNGNPDPENALFEKYLSDLSGEISGRTGTESVDFTLRDMNLNYCTGCFSCWVRTPGKCIFHDDVEPVLKAMLCSDIILYCSPIIMGFTSALLKTLCDRSIPILHPYFVIDRGEVHHRARYDHYPKIGVIYQQEESADEGEFIRKVYSRIAVNMKTECIFAESIEKPVEEAVNELNCA